MSNDHCTAMRNMAAEEMSEYESSRCPREFKTPMELFESGNIVKMCSPMVRYSKNLVRRYGCDLAFTPMIISESFVKSIKARDSDFSTNSKDRPLVVQFAARSSSEFADAAEIVAPYSDGVDLNCGCPQRWAIQEGYGACLLDKPEVVSDMVREARRRVNDADFTVSIKVRTHKDTRKTVELCQRAEKAGVSWITVHGRTKMERTQPVDLATIKLVKESVSVPVVANGDVRSMRDVERVEEETGVDGVMAARGILNNPAMYAGYDYTPLQCLTDWIELSLESGTSFSTFHHHLIYMLDSLVSKADKRLFNSLSSYSAVIQFLRERYGIPSK